MRGLRIPETRRARQLRRNQTSAEEQLWRALRGRKLNGFKFVRQLPLGPYFADFVCREQKLVVEVDGATHGSDAEVSRDERRSAYLAGLGYRVVRITNAEIFGGIENVVEAILAALESPSPSP
ncbi:MAG TPA: DUF559 domain-containing protein [Methylovirgula sp.]|nr:DUF559 domain-containing protein [Methylovirgula sp.]